MGNTYVYEFLIVSEPPSDFHAKLVQNCLKIKLPPIHLYAMYSTYLNIYLPSDLPGGCKSILGKDLRTIIIIIKKYLIILNLVLDKCRYYVYT